MSILVLTSDTLIGTPATGNIEYNGQFYGTDSNASRAQMQRITQGTAVASTSGTSIDFTGLPSWIKRITIMFNGVSGNASSNMLIQIGSGSVTTSGYASQGSYTSTATNITPSTAGFVVWRDAASYAFTGHMVITNITATTWIESHTGTVASNVNVYGAGSSPSLSGALDRVRITTVNGTDTFDAGSVNILYEG